jgi:hypothetical protein
MNMKRSARLGPLDHMEKTLGCQFQFDKGTAGHILWISSG